MNMVYFISHTLNLFDKILESINQCSDTIKVALDVLKVHMNILMMQVLEEFILQYNKITNRDIFISN